MQQGATNPSRSTELARARKLARALDSAIGIPGTRIRFGLDPILGLIPGAGDLAGALLSAYIVRAGARMGAPSSVLARMVLNLGIDTVIGAFPLLGDLFDVGWKANMRNVDLLERLVDREPTDPKASRLAGIAFVVLSLIVVAALGIGLFYLARGLIHALR